MADHVQDIVKLLVEDNKSVFITGAAGTGKTYTTNRIIEILEDRFEVDGNTMNIGRTAMTGLASQLVEGGQTLHSYMGIPVITQILKSTHYPRFNTSDISGLSIVTNGSGGGSRRISAPAVGRVAHTEYLVIDEISMMSDETFDMVVDIAKRVSQMNAELQVSLRKEGGNIVDQIRYIINEFNKHSKTIFLNDGHIGWIIDRIHDTVKEHGVDDISDLPDDDLYPLLNRTANELSSLIHFPSDVKKTMWTQAVENIILYYDDHERQCERWRELHRQANSRVSGYIKFILVGDLLQLSPIIKGPEKSLKNYIIYSKYFNKTHIVPYILETNMRQGEDERQFVDVLSSVRRGQITPEVRKMLDGRVIRRDAPLTQYVEIRSFNKDVDVANSEHLDRLPGQVREYYAVDYLIRVLGGSEYSIVGEGDDKTVEVEGEEVTELLDPHRMFRTFGVHTWTEPGVCGISQVDDKLHLRVPMVASYDIRGTYMKDDMAVMKYKVGAKVILVRNMRLALVTDDDEAEYRKFVNGQQGIVENTYPKSVHVRFGDVVAKVPLYNFSTKIVTEINNEPREYYCMRAQIPLRLGYAVTVHKSQGMTLEGAVLNLDSYNLRFSPPGQAYVALSRLSTLDGLRIRGPIHYPGIVADPTILSYYSSEPIDDRIYAYNRIKYQTLNLPNPIPSPSNTEENWDSTTDDMSIKVKPMGPRRRRPLN